MTSRYLNYDYYYEDYYYDGYDYYYYHYNYDIIFFHDYDLEQETIIDPYNIHLYYNYEHEYNYYYNYYHDNKYKTLPRKLDIFFELQSLMARILIKLEGKEVKDNFEMFYGYNKYPDSFWFIDISEIISTCSLLSFIIALQLSLITYNINMRMIDEKESKLVTLLERHGMSKTKYLFSCLFSFLVLLLFSMISCILLIYGLTNGHIYLFILNIFLFSIALYSVCILFNTCIETTKTGATAIKFYNFGSIFLGFAISLPQTTIK